MLEISLNFSCVELFKFFHSSGLLDSVIFRSGPLSDSSIFCLVIQRYKNVSDISDDEVIVVFVVDSSVTVASVVVAFRVDFLVVVAFCVDFSVVVVFCVDSSVVVAFDVDSSVGVAGSRWLLLWLLS